MLKLRPVQIPVTLTYSGSVASGQVAQLTKGSAMCALIGISFNATDLKFGLFNKLKSLRIGNDNFVQGSGVMVGLLGSGVAPMGADSDYGWSGTSYFPGAELMLVDGTLVGGMPIRGGSTINYVVDDLSAGAVKPLTQLVLHIVQFPDTPDGVRLWKSFLGGSGQVQIIGQDYYQAAGVGLNASANAFTLVPVHYQWTRRSIVLGMALDESVVGHDATVVKETQFRLSQIQMFLNTERPPMNQAVPSRAVAGNSLQWYRGAAAVDGGMNSKNVLQLSAPAPVAVTAYYFATFFEGVPVSDDYLCGQTAI